MSTHGACCYRFLLFLCLLNLVNFLFASSVANLHPAYHNKLTGEIPSEIGLCSSIKRIGMMAAGSLLCLFFFTKYCCPTLHLSSVVPSIDVFNNNLSGSLPNELGNAALLQIFHAKDNAITGTIPAGIGALSFLTWLDLSKNRLTGTIPEDFAQSTSIADFRLGGNKLYDNVPRGLCNNPKINGGATKQHGCDGVICRTGTKSEEGHATFDRACAKCPEGMSNLYLGSSGCGFITEERILDMLYEVLEGGSWREYGWYWNDAKVPMCVWGGNACDLNGELETLAIPLVAASDV